MLHFTCERCGKHLKALESSADRNARCPRCSLAFPVIPSPTLQTTPIGPPADAADLVWEPSLLPPGDVAAAEPDHFTVRRTYKPVPDISEAIFDISKLCFAIALFLFWLKLALAFG